MPYWQLVLVFKVRPSNEQFPVIMEIAVFTVK